MRIRELREKDFKGLSELVLSVYDEMPYAMTFDGRPSDAGLEKLMRQKLQGMKSGEVVDFVAEDGGKIVADCEIVKDDRKHGVVGIIVARGYRTRGLGGEILDRSLARAKDMGVSRAYVEVDIKNGDATEFFIACGFREQASGNRLLMVREL